MKKYVKIEVVGVSNDFARNCPNSTIFLNYTEDGEGAILIMVDDVYKRKSAERYYKSVKYLGEIKMFEEVS